MDVSGEPPAGNLFSRSGVAEDNTQQMKVHVPTPLRSYTAREAVIEANGSTIGELLADIDRRYPGFRFRIIDEQDGIREHIKIFLNEDPSVDLSAPIGSNDVIHIICALSGGSIGWILNQDFTLYRIKI